MTKKLGSIRSTSSWLRSGAAKMWAGLRSLGHIWPNAWRKEGSRSGTISRVLWAVFKRNFISYFSSPTGYVFICVFVLLTTIAAFWPNEFFVANLANLDQLNKWFAFILLVFVPAITMAIWADERRQGTDELLLTLPATDWDVVLGKYLAAVAIYTASLAFSGLCCYWVLAFLGDPDGGLFLSTYFGYWLLGIAMLAVGMVASFLTDNLTIAYILGAVFNMPLVFAGHADTVVSAELARWFRFWSYEEQLRDFTRGIVSVSGILYFLTIIVAMVYLSMILIGRRHWIIGRQSRIMNLHYAVRVVSTIIIGLSFVVIFSNQPIRLDMTSERLNSLSRYTLSLLRELNPERPVQVEAFISPQVPEAYVQTRLNLINTLREINARARGKVQVRIWDTERFSEEAALAEQRYKITPQRRITLERGAYVESHIFMGVAFRCGLERVEIPFIDRGIPVEYELVRSLVTVTQQKRKRVGILRTDARLFGQFDFRTMTSAGNWPIVEELEKQYTVVEVDPSQPITERYDVLLAVQPSSLGPQEMKNFIDAVKRGQPTAIFEDPFPAFAASVPGTSAPRMPGSPMFAAGPMEKGDIKELWQLLGIDMVPDQIIWQDYNPYPKLAQLDREFVFVDEACGARQPFDPADPVTSGLQHLLFPFPGAIHPLNVSKLEFKPLVRTGDRTGFVRFRDVLEMSLFGSPTRLNPNRRHYPTQVSYVLAAHVRGRIPLEEATASQSASTGTTATAQASAGEKSNGNGGSEDASQKSADQQKADSGPAGQTAQTKPEPPTAEQKPKEAEINVIVVADLDMLHREFFRLREEGDIPEAGIRFDFDNVTFVLNIIDRLAGEERFLELRKRRPKHRTLVRIERVTEKARRESLAAREKLIAEFEKAQEEEQKKLDERVKKLEEEFKKRGDIPLQDVLIRVAMAQKEGQRRLDARIEQLRQQRDAEINRIETELNLYIRRVQNAYKRWAVALPPIPPLVVGLAVFAYRRFREYEGVEQSRLRR
ncbi:MAG: Gldg family protein [Thermoguttaceae bacterium]|nr:Gldg family protein [Thermoguttaceae bacterium]MDW8079464.1 Gldg family protein [Thermoguttaceae bacterium]